MLSLIRCAPPSAEIDSWRDHIMYKGRYDYSKGYKRGSVVEMFVPYSGVMRLLVWLITRGSASNYVHRGRYVFFRADDYIPNGSPPLLNRDWVRQHTYRPGYVRYRKTHRPR